MQDKPGRNDPCPCGSGSKYKKCCESQEKKRFIATKIEDSDLKLKTASFSKLFKSHVADPKAEIPPKDN